MKDFNEVIKLKIIPTTFVFRCSLCGLEISDYDRHFGLIKMNEHVIAQHPNDINPLDKEELYSRKPSMSLESF
jgi:hypothetical protein